MDQQTEGKNTQSPSCSCGMGGCHCHGRFGRFSWLRALIALVIAILLFMFGFALGRVSGSRSRAGNMMYRRGTPMMRYYPTGAPGTMMPYGNQPSATTTPAK